jgi:hypothetical protein
MVAAMPLQRETRLLLAHVTTQVACLVALWLVPTEGWPNHLLQTLAGLLSAGFFLEGIRTFRPRPALAWYLIGFGLLVSGLGNTVEIIAWRCCQATASPNVADAFWLTLHGGLLSGLALLVHRQAACEELGAGTLATIGCALLNLFVGVMAWQYIVWRGHSDHSLTLANRFIVTLYPLADLMVIALILRLLLGGGFRNASLLLIATSLGWFLASDLGWSDFIRSHAFPDRVLQYVVEATSMIARAVLGAATLLPSVRTVTAAPEGPLPRLGWLGWLGIAASTLTAPIVLALQALLDRLYSVASF